MTWHQDNNETIKRVLVSQDAIVTKKCNETDRIKSSHLRSTNLHITGRISGSNHQIDIRWLIDDH
jgi:predicted acyltransferase (DUF342 family)